MVDRCVQTRVMEDFRCILNLGFEDMTHPMKPVCRKRPLILSKKLDFDLIWNFHLTLRREVNRKRQAAKV